MRPVSPAGAPGRSLLDLERRGAAEGVAVVCPRRLPPARNEDDAAMVRSGGEMASGPRMTLTATVLDAPDARELAAFYQRLLGWTVGRDEPGWATLRPPDGGAGLSFQTEEAYVRPTWPAGPGDQQMMMHLDIEVGDLDVAGAHAIVAGATLAEFQPQEKVRVYLDPAGHPFCLWTQ
jgi:catechol 2,3-dioxygenase-like lactoylglutathione lyase family enzyme